MNQKIKVNPNGPIESIEYIPMNKESIFEEPYVEAPATPEEGGTTHDVDVWLQRQSEEAKNEAYIEFNRRIDLDTSRWFAKHVKVEGYMLGPVAVINNDGKACSIVAKSIKVTDFREFIDYAKNNKIWPYQFLFQANLPVTGQFDLDTLEAKYLECPVVDTKSGYWVIRFGELSRKETT